MNKLVFRKNNEKYYNELVIEAGYWDKSINGEDFFYSILDICPVNKEVRTDCGDSYMDYSIGFKEFLEVADKIKEIERVKNE